MQGVSKRWKQEVVSSARSAERGPGLEGLEDSHVWERIWKAFLREIELDGSLTRGTIPSKRTLKNHMLYNDVAPNKELERLFFRVLPRLSRGGWMRLADKARIEQSLALNRKENRQHDDDRKRIAVPEDVGSRQPLTQADIDVLSAKQFDVFRYAFKGSGFCTREILKLGLAKPNDIEIDLIWYFRMSREDPHYVVGNDIKEMHGKCVRFDGDLYFICGYREPEGTWRSRRCLVLSEPTDDGGSRSGARWGVIKSTAPASSLRYGQPVWGKTCFVRSREGLGKEDFLMCTKEEQKGLLIARNPTQLLKALSAESLSISDGQFRRIFSVLGEVVNKKELLSHISGRFPGQETELIEEIFSYMAERIDPGLLWYDGSQDAEAGFASA